MVALLSAAAVVACLGVRPTFGQEGQRAAAPQPAPNRYWDCVSPLCTYVQPQDKNKPPQPYGGGTPLDVILNTKLWTTAPEAADFVKATRPPEDTLHYQSTGGTDIARPKLKTHQELQKMQDELERAGVAADRAAGLRSHFHVEHRQVAKGPRDVSPGHAPSSTSASSLGASETRDGRQ